MLPTNSLEIELTTKCTLGCPSCPRNNPYDSRKLWDVGHIDTDMHSNPVFIDIDNNTSDNCAGVHLNGFETFFK